MIDGGLADGKVRSTYIGDYCILICWAISRHYECPCLFTYPIIPQFQRSLNSVSDTWLNSNSLFDEALRLHSPKLGDSSAASAPHAFEY